MANSAAEQSVAEWVSEGKLIAEKSVVTFRWQICRPRNRQMSLSPDRIRRPSNRQVGAVASRHNLSAEQSVDELGRKLIARPNARVSREQLILPSNRRGEFGHDSSGVSCERSIRRAIGGRSSVAHRWVAKDLFVAQAADESAAIRSAVVTFDLLRKQHVERRDRSGGLRRSICRASDRSRGVIHLVGCDVWWAARAVD